MFDKMKEQCEAAINAFKTNLDTLRTGKANAKMLDNLFVEFYGQRLPINQVGAVSVADARLLTIQVWDTNAVKATVSAIAESKLDLNPQASGNTIRVPIPALTEERRKNLVKIASTSAETAKVSVRNARREALELLKKSKGELPEDDIKKKETDVQNITNDYVKKSSSFWPRSRKTS